MHARQLGVTGAFAFTPVTYPDDRGFFLSPFQESAFVEAVGHRLFPVAQTSYSRSRRGVVRGVHFTTTPPGMAKYVYCLRGKAIDVVVDVRTGSPTYGRWDSVLLDERNRRAVYFPVGAAHLFVALEDDTVMSYLLSGEYVRDNELAVSSTDPQLDLPLGDGATPILSDRDRAAPTLATALATGLLPDYETCRRIEAGFA